jgi:hypothetical protein
MAGGSARHKLHTACPFGLLTLSFPAVPVFAVQVNATQNVEARICERLHIGGHISYRRLLEDLAAMGFSSNQVGV